MAAFGRKPPLVVALDNSPLFGAKQPFRKHYSNRHERRLTANSCRSVINTDCKEKRDPRPDATSNMP